MKNLSFLLFAIVFINPTNLHRSFGIEPTTDSMDEIKKNIADKKAVLIDVRELNEWNEGHLQDASHLALKKIAAGVTQEELDKIAPPDKIVYLHCASGFRSIEAAKLLEDRHKGLRPLKQGYKALLKAGLPKSP